MGNFKRWILETGGPGKVSDLLDVTEHGVRRWLRREAVPRASTMVTIVRLSKGKVDYADIVKETKPPVTKKKA